MTIDITELIRNIRAWEAARERHDNATPEQGGTWHAVQYAAKKVTGSFLQSDELLPQFVALADHCERLQARIDAALVICDTNYTDSKGEYRDGVNAARDEIYDVLTGKSQ